MKNLLKILVAFVVIYYFSSCRKENDFNTDASVKLSFSEDTLLFDTIFTTIGSTTQYLVVYNKESQPLKISSIRLAKGSSSSYRMNVDGVATKSTADVEIGPKDSLIIFVEITIDPNNSTTPFLVTDSILFETNGNLQDVDLVAFGQNAHFFTPTGNFSGIQYSIIPCNAIWDSILPYVIYGYAVVDSGCKLTITEGTKIYFYANSGLWVFQGGILKATGSYQHPVTFQGTRLEDSYQDLPGQWDRIWINEGFGPDSNEIDYAIIKNGFIGLQPENLFTAYGQNPRKLRVTNTIIKNMSGFGMLARDYTVHGVNNVFANCGQYIAALTIGGSYDFLHCTFSNNCLNGGQRTTPSVYLNNYYSDITGDHAVNLNVANFRNCIIYGNIDNELQLDFISGANSEYSFGNCLMKNDTSIHISDAAHFENIISNQDPQFINCSDNDYMLDGSSPAIDAGNGSYLPFNLQLDLDSKLRIAGSAPDLGAYEKQ
ncbi:MAG: choice-of-anchor Q domain-containing protein [Bacteroidia bacterium]